MRNRNAYTVIPTRAGIQHHPRESRPPLWTPDQVRGDGALGKCLLTLRSEASRRVGPLKAPYLQPLLRDGALAPHQDENGTIWGTPRWYSCTTHANRARRPGPRIKSGVTVH